MRRLQNEKSTGSKGFERKGTQGPARWGGRVGTGVAAPSTSDCNRDGVRGEAGAASLLKSSCNKIGTWNVHSLGKPGKLANVTKEMERMGVGIMGVAETCWCGDVTFTTQLPESEGGAKYRVFISGGEKRRRGVGLVVKEEMAKSILMWEPISDRITIMRLKMAPINMLVAQIYAPCEDADEEEKDQFYERLDQVIQEYKKGRECLVVMGDFNGKVGNDKEEDTIGPFGVGVRNDNGERIVNLSKRHNLFVTNTWFQQKRSAQHTWTSPDKNTKNQIDYILVDKRFRNGVQNSKSMPGADCESDHNPVVATMKIKLQRVKKSKKTAKWNINSLKKPENRNAYETRLDKEIQEKKINEWMEIDEIWQKLSESIEIVAEEICGKEEATRKQSWMNADILRKMEERRQCKLRKDEGQYKKLKQEIQKLCREAKDKYFEDKCKEIEGLDKVHSHLLYQKIKEFRPKGNRMVQMIKSKEGNNLVGKEEVMERWAEYVEELYKDEGRGETDMGDLVNEVYTISSEEIKSVIKELPKGKTCGNDNIAAELLQGMGEKGMGIMTSLINKIYNSGYIPEEFRKSIFVPIPKVSRAQECNDFRTIALISHASKVLLHLIKRRITPIIERQLGESQMGFRKGKGTRDAIFQLRMISERTEQMNIVKKIGRNKIKKGKKLYLCFVDYQKAFDRVRHDKLVEVMEWAGVPELERRLIINLYWRQHAAVRWDDEVSRNITVERGVRQGCVISPLLFNLYSEFMIKEAMEDVEGVQFNGNNITNLRYADDAVLVADKRWKMQKMIDRLNETCKAYGMEINVKKTKVMIMNGTKKPKDRQRCITLNNVPLEQVSRFKYLGSWITEDARCEVDIKARVGMAKAAFWQNKELMRGNIRFSTKLKILNCYVFSILNYGCESWSWNKITRRKVNAFETWCYRRMLKISWMDKITNEKVLKRMQTKLHFVEDMMKRKMRYAGHVLRGSSGLSHLQILEGWVEGIRKVGGPRRTWIKDICDWTGMSKYDKVKRAAEEKESWKLKVATLRYEVGKGGKEKIYIEEE